MRAKNYLKILGYKSLRKIHSFLIIGDNATADALKKIQLGS